MRKTLGLLLIVISIFLASCAMPDMNEFQFNEVDFTKDSVTFWIKSEKKYLSIENKAINDKLRNITNWVYNNIQYDHEWVNQWKSGLVGYKQQTPMQTLMTRKGICADMSYLIWAIADYQLHIKIDVAEFAGKNSLGVYDVINNGHYANVYNNIVYDATGSIIMDVEQYKKNYILQTFAIFAYDQVARHMSLFIK